MKHWERVMKAIKHEVPDRVPYGELQVPSDIVGKYLGREMNNLSAEEKINLENEFFTDMDMDLVVVPGYEWVDGQALFRDEAVAEVRWWRENTDLFVFGLVNGGFSQLLCTHGLHELLPMIDKEPIETANLIEAVLEENLTIAERLVEAGAHAVIVGDDFAYAKGTFVNPIVMRQIVFPSLTKAFRKIRSWGVPAFLHVDGNINYVIEDIMQLGIDGLHSLQPTAGIDIGEIKAKYGKKVCLMGNLDLELFYYDDKDALTDAVDNLMEVAKPGGGFILSSSSGLEDGIVIEQLDVLQGAVLDKGRY